MTVVLHAVPGAWLPVTQSWLHDQLRFLPESIESHVACERTEHLDRFPVEHLHVLPSRRRQRVLARLVRELDVSLIHSHFGPEAWRNASLARRLRKRHVVTFYGYDATYLPTRHAKWRRRYRTLLRQTDLVLCEGPHLAELVKGLGCPPDRVRVHRLGVDIASIPYRPRRWSPRETLRVLLASSFRPKKGLTFAIEALGRLAADHDLRITVVGDATAASSSVTERRRIFAAIDRAGLDRRVTRTGFVSRDRLHELAYEHHLLIAPSVTADDGDGEGGAPVSIIELAATGLPIVATMHGDIPAVVHHGVTGFLARERDVDDLLRQVRRTLAMADRWPEMLGAARHHVETHFDAAEQGRRLAAIYAELAHGLRLHDAPRPTPVRERHAA